jgi:hypothetical protein
MKTYFKSHRFLVVDTVLCYVIACLITPADPLSAILAFVLLLMFWLPVRFYIARRLSRS